MNSNRWIAIFTLNEKIELKCKSQGEIQKLMEIFILQIRIDCKLYTPQETVINIESIISTQTILLPGAETLLNTSLVITLNLHSSRIQLTNARTQEPKSILHHICPQPLLHDSTYICIYIYNCHILLFSSTKSKESQERASSGNRSGIGTTHEPFSASSLNFKT